MGFGHRGRDVTLGELAPVSTNGWRYPRSTGRFISRLGISGFLSHWGGLGDETYFRTDGAARVQRGGGRGDHAEKGRVGHQLADPQRRLFNLDVPRGCDRN